MITFRHVILILLVAFSSINIVSQITYPEEKSLSLESKIISGLIVPTDKDNPGGTLNLGLEIVDIPKRYSFGVCTGYNYLYDREDLLINYLDLGLTAGYKYLFFDTFGITPNLGFLVNYGISNGGVTFGFLGAVDFNVHLYDRNILFFRGGVSHSFNSDIGSNFIFSIGLKRSFPISIPINPVKMKIDLGSNNFSPDGDGEDDLLNIKLKARNRSSIREWAVTVYDENSNVVIKWFNKGKIPRKIVWDGIDRSGVGIDSGASYKIISKTVDFKGREVSAEVNFLSDILVDRLDDKYRIRISSINFPPNSADLTKLSSYELRDNRLVVRKLVEKLNRYPDYKIRIEGHGNLVHWRSKKRSLKENKDILVPLTFKRAFAIKKLLVEEGMSESRITVTGLGGSFPLVPFNNSDNWRNRRVEFILLK